MKIYAQRYKTFEGARKRAAFENSVHRPKRWYFGVRQLSFDPDKGSDFRLTRETLKEVERRRAIELAKKVLLGTTS